MATVDIFDMADAWNDGVTVFTAIKMNVTDTASDAASLLLDLQVGGASKFSVAKAGTVTAGAHTVSGSDATVTLNLTPTWNTTGVPSVYRANVTNTSSPLWSLLFEGSVGGTKTIGLDRAGGIRSNNLLAFFADFTTTSNKWAEFRGTNFGLVNGTDFIMATDINTVGSNKLTMEYVEAGVLRITDAFGAYDRASDPSNPANGSHVIWQSDGTGSGDDGDIMVKITDAGGTTKTITLVDYSAF